MINNIVFRRAALETLNIKVVGSFELTYYWTIQMDDSGCVEVAATVFGAKESEQTISIDPREAIQVAEAIIAIAKEELARQAF